jgi:hypothetical protein
MERLFPFPSCTLLGSWKLDPSWHVAQCDHFQGQGLSNCHCFPRFPRKPPESRGSALTAQPCRRPLLSAGARNRKVPTKAERQEEMPKNQRPSQGGGQKSEALPGKLRMRATGTESESRSWRSHQAPFQPQASPAPPFSPPFWNVLGPSADTQGFC